MFTYWGKAQDGWHLLPYHSLDVATCAQALLHHRTELNDKLIYLTGLDANQLNRWCGFFSALHDLGKFSSAFQGLVPEVWEELGHTGLALAYTARHDSLGWALWLETIGPKLSKSRSTRRSLNVWARASTGHHGQPPSRAQGASTIRIQNHFSDGDIEAAMRWVVEAQRLFNPDLTAGSKANFERASWWIAGLMTLADWLGSNALWFPYHQTPMDIGDYWVIAQQQAELAIHEAGLASTPTHWRSFAMLFPEYTPKSLQTAVGELRRSGPTLMLIEDLTGSGKTEAALVAAGDHFYFALPTMATANGLWQRVSENTILTGSKTLAHSARWLMPSAMNSATSWLNDSTRRALLSQMGVGTIDQAILAVLYARHSTLRLVGLADKTLIVDEVHACDEYQRAILKVLIEFQARIGGSIILLSATLPQSHRSEYAAAWAKGRGIQEPELQANDYPLVTQVGDQTNVEIHVAASQTRHVHVAEEDNIGEVVRRIIVSAKSGRCVCWVRNTVRDAIEAFDFITARGMEPDLFHARFTVADRAAIEQRVLARFGKSSTPNDRQGRILVATQVVEQSLDIDFDFMVSDIAPIDLLVQRAGRLHRHDRGDRGIPQLLLHSPRWSESPSDKWVSAWNSGTAYVYPDHGRLWLTVKMLRQQNGMHLPRDARMLIEGVYGESAEDYIPQALRTITINETGTGLARAAMAGIHAIKPSASYEADGTIRWEEERVPTRLGDPTVEWVLVSGGQPLNRTVVESTVRLRRASLVDAPTDDKIKCSPWQRVMVLQPSGAAWRASGMNQGGQRVDVQYDRLRGLVVT